MSGAASLAVVADAHLGGPGGEAGPLVAQIRALPEEGVERLVLLGDLLQVWVGYEQYQTAESRALLAAVAEVRARGLRVDYIEGNRDFFLAAGPCRGAFDSVGTEIAATAGGVRHLLVHGDGLNDRDRQYLAWRWLSKSWPVRTVIRRLPRRAVAPFLHGTERRLSGTNFKHKAEIPEAAIRRYAERRLAEGHDLLVLGHFHEPRRWQVAGGEVLLLDAWFKSRRVERLG
ncbi:MAG: UDP-2,3-diacylglucosamine diphosphatase [Thermoanaerobaculia bacterium]|nr:UDP-2,3-diacylglucosamine diphosphatase [Thermoanaerobaculia bacterium]